MNDNSDSKSQALPATLPLLHGRTTLEEALDEEDNMLVRLAYYSQRLEFFVWVHNNCKEFLSLVSLHLCLAHSETCRFGEFKEWKYGSFNLCIPIYIENWRKHPGKRVLLRLPLPYKVGESKYPGNIDEKLRTEAATFIWIQENCLNIPIPHLWGFGFPGGQSFIKPENTSWITRTTWYLQRAISFFFSGSTLPCRYIGFSRQSILDSGYLIMDYIETTEAKLLAESWNELGDRELRTNLFKGLSRIMLTLSKTPLPCIGSWTINDQGILTLANRPLTYHFHSLENEGIPTNVLRSRTYMSTDSYYNDLLKVHDSRIRHQPNSIFTENDGLSQMANLFVMRGVLPHFESLEFRHGPFIFNLTDLHRGNIFIDSKWNIKYVIDLEWACSLPIEMLAPPEWISGCYVNELTGERLQGFENTCQEFMDIFEEEEKSFPLKSVYGSTQYRTDIMRRGLRLGNFWFFHALKNPQVIHTIFDQHIQPMFEPRQDVGYAQIVASYWAPATRAIIAAKLEDKEKYDHKLRELFEKAESSAVMTDS